MNEVRTASRYLLAILVTFLLTRAWLDAARPGLVPPAPGGAGPRRAVGPGPAAHSPALEPEREPYKEVATPRPDIAPELLRLSDADERINIEVYAASNRGVVNITTSATEVGFFGEESPSGGTGSGFVLDQRGHILTNNHVIEGAESLQVTMPDGTSREARLVGADPTTDVAVIRVEAEPEALHPLPLGDSSDLKVGQKVLAIGNPFGLERTLTTGIISSLDRTIKAKNGRAIKGIIQTDAAINPGNSGGPLLNPRGEVIGMNTAILSQVGQSAGIGFTVPIASIRRILKPLIEQGRVIRGDLGVQRIFQADEGLIVVDMVRDGPADRAGVRPFYRLLRRGNVLIRQADPAGADRITAVDGKPVRTAEDLFAEVESHPPGTEVNLSVLRNKKPVQVPVTLGES